MGSAQKSGVGVPAYTRWVNRSVARIFSASFSHLGATPSTVSVVSIVVTLMGLAGFLALQSSPWAAGTLAAVALAAGYALDSADGQLARLQGSSSLRGEWLDHSLDAVRLPAVHLVVGAAFLIQGMPVLAVVAAAFSVVASAGFLSQNLGGILRDRSVGDRSAVRPFQSWILLPVDPGVLCWIFLFWAVGPVFIALYIALFAMNLLHAAASARRRWRELGEGDAS